MKSRLLQYDTRDDRKEVYQLLQRLSPRDRLRWLAACCRRATLPGSTKQPAVTPMSTGQEMEVYLDFWSLVNEWTFDADAALEDLVRIVKQRGRPL